MNEKQTVICYFKTHNPTKSTHIFFLVDVSFILIIVLHTLTFENWTLESDVWFNTNTGSQALSFKCRNILDPDRIANLCYLHSFAFVSRCSCTFACSSSTGVKPFFFLSTITRQQGREPGDGGGCCIGKEGEERSRCSHRRRSGASHLLCTHARTHTLSVLRPYGD